MKLTSIRIKGQLPSTDSVLAIVADLNRRFKRAGYTTNVQFGETRSSIKIGLHMRSFKLDLTKHDRNLRHNPHLGAKLTDVPTWDQRVEFNDIVNSVLNKHKVSCNVKSGPFTIRKGTQAFTEDDWHDQTPEYLRHNESHGYYIETVDEREFLEERRIARNKLAQQRRAQRKSDELALARDAKQILGF